MNLGRVLCKIDDDELTLKQVITCFAENELPLDDCAVVVSGLAVARNIRVDQLSSILYRWHLELAEGHFSNYVDRLSGHIN